MKQNFKNILLNRIFIKIVIFALSLLVFLDHPGIFGEQEYLLNGIVHDKKGNGISFVRILFFCENGFLKGSTITDERGEFKMQMAPGTYKILAVKNRKFISKKWVIGDTNMDILEFNWDKNGQYLTVLINILPSIIGAIIGIFVAIVGFKLKQRRCKRTFRKYILSSIQEKFNSLIRLITSFRKNWRDYIVKCEEVKTSLRNSVERLLTLSLSYEERYGQIFMTTYPQSLIELGKLIQIIEEIQISLKEVSNHDLDWLIDQKSVFSQRVSKLENYLNDLQRSSNTDE